MRGVLRVERDKWQWIGQFLMVRRLKGETEKNRWLTLGRSEKLTRCCVPDLVVLMGFALATCCHASKITGL